MKPCELVTLVTALSCVIAKNFSSEDAALLAAAFTQLGDSITTILVAEELKADLI
ncbi:MAG: hypothetical protein PHE51_07850 [Eubacteriales bacterium]|nr:hypothetical protein [Eubacteriales bacterium]